MDKVMRKIALTMATILILMLPCPTIAIAASGKKITYNNFDYITYANTYPDLLQTYGYNRKSLYNHYKNQGKSEGRKAKTLKYLPNKITAYNRDGVEGYYFDAVRYAADYPDLYDAFGNNKDALWDHYKSHGIAEGRIAYGTTAEANAKLKVFDVAYKITNDSMSDKEKVREVHDWIVNHTAYDYDNYLNGTIPDKSYELEGIMLKGTGVCSAYAKVFSYFMYALGIECEYLSGEATNSVGSTGRHAWNRVYINDKWLYVDCTWDDPICDNGQMLRHDYFLISYDKMSQDHIQEESRKLY